MSEQARPRRRVLRGVLIGVLVLVLVVVAAGAIGWASFDPDTLKPRIAEAVKRATGRDLALRGPLGLRPGFAPTITAQDVALANIAGGSRPEMATVQRLQISVALWPLLSNRVVIEGLTLEHPDILLERNAQGVPNWILRPEVPAQTLPQATPTAPRARTQVELRAVRIENGRVAWRDDRGHVSVADIPNLAFDADSQDGPAHLAGTLAAHGVPIAVSADTGPLAALQAGKPAQPWPVKLSLAGLGGHVAANGTLADPLQLTGYTVDVDAAVPDLAQLNRIFPHAKLPSVHDVALTAHVADGGGRIPQVSALKLHTGAAHLSAYVPELDITSLDLAEPAQDKPATVDFKGTYRTVPVALAGSFGPPRALLPLSGTPLSVDLTGHAADATVSFKGGIPASGLASGVDLVVAAKLPDLTALDPFAGRQLPALKNVSFSGRVNAQTGRIVLSELALSSAQGDISGGAAWEHKPGGRPHITANLASKSLDIDAFQAAFPAPPPAPPPLQPAPSQAAPAAPAPHGPARVIPDTPLPVASLRRADADIHVNLASVRAGGEEYRNVAGQLVLANGHLTVAPISAVTPGGPAQGALEVDASQPTPSVGIVLHAPDLALAPLLAALHQAADATGTVMVDADLHGTGDTVRAVAGTLDGHLGLAMVNGQIDNALLTRAFGKVLSSAHLPAELAGHTDVRCFALRLDAQHGVANVAAFALDTTRLSLTGSGSINLADEGLALQLHPLLRIGGNGVAVPVRVSGTFADPQAGLDAAMPGGRVGAVIGALSGAGQGDSCGPALAAARNGQPGPAPAPPRSGGANVNDLLRLFRSR